jgi:hypothetical protein
MVDSRHSQERSQNSSELLFDICADQHTASDFEALVTVFDL